MPMPFTHDEHVHLLKRGVVVGVTLFALVSIYNLMLN